MGGAVWFANSVRDHEKLTKGEAYAWFFSVFVATYFMGNLAFEYTDISVRVIWLGQAMLGHFGESLYAVFGQMVKRHFSVNVNGGDDSDS